MIERCWSEDQSKRPTFVEIFNKLAFNNEEWIVDFYEGTETEDEYDINKYFLDNVDKEKIFNYVNEIREVTPYEKLKSENDDLKQKIMILQEETKNSKKDILHLTNENKKIRKQMRSIMTDHDDLLDQFRTLMQNQEKNIKQLNTFKEEIEKLTKENENNKIQMFMDNLNEIKYSPINVHDPQDIKQIIMINFDQSIPLIGNQNGINVAYQYLISFVNKIFCFNVPSIIGLVTFGYTIEIKRPLSESATDFEYPDLKNGCSNSKPKLLDSISISCKEIVKFKTEKYKNARSRIFVISCNDDFNSDNKIDDVVKELKINHIEVDSIIASSENIGKLLCTLCHITGGFSFHPKNIFDGTDLITKYCFIDKNKSNKQNLPLIPNNRRTKPSLLRLESITADFIEQVKQNAEFDEQIESKFGFSICNRNHFSTLRYVCFNINDSDLPHLDQRKEFIINEFKINRDKSDQNIKMFTLYNAIDIWVVFIKGPDKTPYANKWWHLIITFPSLYPNHPPILRFVSVPFHLNVQSDGAFSVYNNKNKYRSSMHVHEIITDIVNLLAKPDTYAPVESKWDIFLNHRNQYEELAKKSAEDNAKNNFCDYIENCSISDFINELNDEIDESLNDSRIKMHIYSASDFYTHNKPE